MFKPSANIKGFIGISLLLISLGIATHAKSGSAVRHSTERRYIKTAERTTETTNPAQTEAVAESSDKSSASSLFSDPPVQKTSSSQGISNKNNAGPARRAYPGNTQAKTDPTAAAQSDGGKSIIIITFGYSFGPPPAGMKYVADVRNINVSKFNFKPSQTGLQQSVRDKVMSVQAAKDRLAYFRAKWEPNLINGDKVAIGCSRGHHRSVTMAYYLAQDMKNKGYTVNLIHRDINKTW